MRCWGLRDAVASPRPPSGYIYEIMADERDIRALKDIEQVEKINEWSWAVESRNCKDPYVVDDLQHGDWECGCGDCQKRGAVCKHIRRVQMVIGERPIPRVDLTDFAGNGGGAL